MIRLLLGLPLLLSPLAAQAPPTWTVDPRPLVTSGGADTDNIETETMHRTTVLAGWPDGEMRCGS